MVKSMSMFIQQAHTAIFACTFMKTLVTSAATANRTIMALIYIPLKRNVCSFFKTFVVSRVPRSSAVKCLTRDPGVLGSSRTRSSGFFRGSVLRQDTYEPSLVLVKPREDMNSVSCSRDITEILLNAA